MQGEDADPSASQGTVLWVDAETLAPESTADDLADELLAARRRRGRAARSAPPPAGARGVRGLKGACESLLERGERLCVVIDEYDLLFEREAGRGPLAGLSYLFRLLRAWGQQWQGAVSLTLIGRDPEHFGVPQLDGVSNPLLGWFKLMWLGPLEPPQDANLLKRLGRRVSLEVGDKSAALARKWSGGHPMLLREFGAALRQEVLQENRGRPFPLATDAHCQTAVARFLRREHVRDVDREIFALLRRRYPEALDLILRIVDGVPLDLDSDVAGSPAQVLRNFGLLDDMTHALPEHLVWYARTLLPRERPRVRGEGARTQPEQSR